MATMTTSPRAAMVAEIDEIRAAMAADRPADLGVEERDRQAVEQARAALLAAQETEAGHHGERIGRQTSANRRIADIEHELRTSAPAELAIFADWLLTARNRARSRYGDRPGVIAAVIAASLEVESLRVSPLTDAEIVAQIAELKDAIGITEGARE